LSNISIVAISVSLPVTVNNPVPASQVGFQQFRAIERFFVEAIGDAFNCNSADFPLIRHTNFFFSHLEKVHTMFFSPFQLLCTFFHHEYKRTPLHRTYAED